MSNSCILFIERILPGANILCESEPVSNGNEEVLYISHISKAGASPSDGLMSNPKHSLGEGFYSSAVYSTVSADWAVHVSGLSLSSYSAVSVCSRVL